MGRARRPLAKGHELKACGTTHLHHALHHPLRVRQAHRLARHGAEAGVVDGNRTVTTSAMSATHPRRRSSGGGGRGGARGRRRSQCRICRDLGGEAVGEEACERGAVLARSSVDRVGLIRLEASSGATSGHGAATLTAAAAARLLLAAGVVCLCGHWGGDKRFRELLQREALRHTARRQHLCDRRARQGDVNGEGNGACYAVAAHAAAHGAVEEFVEVLQKNDAAGADGRELLLMC